MNDLPRKILVWHGPHPLPHAGSWATTRYPQEAEEYVKVAALPGMVHPLVWEGVEADCFVICELDGRSYELCVVDTLERTCDYLWSVTYYVGRQGARIMCGKPETFESAKAAAQAHHVATIMQAFGVQGGET